MEKKTLIAPSLGHLLERTARENPDKTFLIFDDTQISYAEIDRRVNKLANGLKEIGVSKGVNVSVMLPNGFEFPITWLALAKLGAVMVPTNVNYQAHDLEYTLLDSDAEVMVVHEDYLAVLESVKNNCPKLREIVLLGNVGKEYLNFEELTDKASADFTMTDVEENDLINIQYTSGTTGFPKGCMLTHRFWILMAQSIVEEVDEAEAGTQDDVLLTAQPFFYIDPQWNTTLAMAAGISLVIMKRFSPSNFWPTVQKYGVTFFYLAGTMPFYLLELEENPELERNHKVKMIGCGGLPPQFHAELERRWGTPVREGFGMTETGADLGISIDDEESVGSGAMGAPVPTKEARVVDENDRELPDGTTGELVVRGEPMMIGYWNKPKETAEAMRGGWFHTGDLAFKDEKGYFHWVGRIKDMVRRSGENISAAEVEGVLTEHRNVTAAAVVPVPDRLRGEEVKAYLVLKSGETPDTTPPEEIIESIREKISYFKIPRYLEYIGDLPRTPSERVEKHKLIKLKEDLRTGSYDAVDKKWR
ncbi:MAG: ATP-dependent acyl-CoA ligase [Deltaproteobacteria bacterium]|nr:ATP-dependent acyl-CoA ligase [Deltaproteobacteria bacterium]